MPDIPLEQTRELQRRVHDLDFRYLTKGSAPLVLLVHGFPDIPQSWSAQIDALSAAGYIGYALCAARPDLLHSATLMAVPHPAVVSQYLLAPKHIHRSFHWWFFQQNNLPEQALLADDMYFIDYLWQYWTVPNFQDDSHIREVKKCLREPGVLSNALAYYRAMFDETLADPALNALRSTLSNKISVPTLAMCGAEDTRTELMRDQSEYFSGRYLYLEIPNARHFPHREQSQRVNELLIDWLRQRHE